jgi:signal transduction histidine kinase
MPSVDGMTTATAAAGATSGTTPTILRRLGVDTAYVLLGFPLAVVSFVVLVTGFALGIGLAITVVGLPVLAGALHAARAFADIERVSLGRVLGMPVPRPLYRTAEPGASVWRRTLIPLTDGQAWFDLAYGCLRLIVSVIAFAFTVTWWAGTLGGTFFWAYDWAIPRGPDNVQLNDLLGLGDTTAARLGLHTAIGLFFLLTLPLVVRASAALQAAFGRTMLSQVAEMRNRISVLEEQKRAAVSAETTALRRLERDIHDGPQQRLVRLAMDLGRAQQQMGSDPEAARVTLDEALAQTRETLAELRALSRGIAPPILVDRGLPSALAALAERGLIPIELSVDPSLGTATGRLDATAESTAYFVVAEALTNVAKHSRATRCWVSVHKDDGRLRISVGDDGQGGAHVAKGHGLAGIADRVRAHGGTLTVTSPPGGPTEIRADLPS